MTDPNEFCACGRKLHYVRPTHEKIVRDLVDKLGPNVWINADGQTAAYLVPRHYIALHGVLAHDLPALAEQFGWRVEQVAV